MLQACTHCEAQLVVVFILPVRAWHFVLQVTCSRCLTCFHVPVYRWHPCIIGRVRCGQRCCGCCSRADAGLQGSQPAVSPMQLYCCLKVVHYAPCAPCDQLHAMSCLLTAAVYASISQAVMIARFSAVVPCAPLLFSLMQTGAWQQVTALFQLVNDL